MFEGIDWRSLERHQEHARRLFEKSPMLHALATLPPPEMPPMSPAVEALMQRCTDKRMVAWALRDLETMRPAYERAVKNLLAAAKSF